MVVYSNIMIYHSNNSKQTSTSKIITSFNLTSPELCEQNQKSLSIINIFFFKFGIPNKLFVHIYCIHDPHVVYGSCSAFSWLLLTKSVSQLLSVIAALCCSCVLLPLFPALTHICTCRGGEIPKLRQFLKMEISVSFDIAEPQ